MIPLEFRLIAGLVLVATLILGGRYIVHEHDKGVADGINAIYAKQAASAVEAARAKEQGWLAAQSEAQSEAQRLSNRARTDAGVAADADVRLQHRIALGSGISPHPAASGVGPSTAAAPDLLADVLGRVSEAARQLAATADDSRIAGSECERDFDALGNGHDR